MAEKCGWAGPEAIYIKYHAHEWGVPQYDGRLFWQMLVLESFQAGLSWIIILRRRESFFQAFEGLDPNVIATWGEVEVKKLLIDKGIIRHRGKIEATLSNAKAWQKIEAEGGFSHLQWGAVSGQPIQNNWHDLQDVPAETVISLKLSAQLKAEGFRFCGPKTVYALMQAAGLVNDHLVECPAHAKVRRLAGVKSG